ncbi:MAG: ABC transporter permease [bacterium]|nr:ABC transporter permease [bacterium]
MTIRHSFLTAIKGLRTNRSRSALTILGIVIGITAIMIVMSVGQGAQDLILGQIQGLGSKTIVVIPGREPKGPSDAAQIFSDSLKEKDIEALHRKENVSTLDTIMPVVFGGETAVYAGETFRLTIFGASEFMQEMFDIVPSEGAMFTADDVRNRSDVVVIGSKVKEELFHGGDALGEKMKIKGRSFKIIGILPKKGQVNFFNFDEMAIAPYTTAQQYIFGIKHFHRLIMRASSEDVIPETVRDIQATLRASHGITDASKDDFFVQTQVDLAARFSSITDILTLLLVAVAAISLLVGGVGIMNIMLVAVTERTREIGLRKAIGATDRDILLQFLLEAVVLTGVGGIVGILLGAILSFLVALILSRVVGLGWVFAFPLNATLLGLSVSAIIGIIFGLYPARQAAKKSPMEALRYE